MILCKIRYNAPKFLLYMLYSLIFLHIILTSVFSQSLSFPFSYIPLRGSANYIEQKNSTVMCCFSIVLITPKLIFIRLLSVTIFTKHLTIIRCCMATLAPWLNMVTFHFFILKMFFTNRANATLLTVRS